VAAELRALPEVTDVQEGPGAVSFAGPLAALYRANLHLRCASRVVQLLSDTPCAGADDLYAAARALPWEDFMPPDGTLAVSARGLLPGIDNSMFAALRVKDAVCDRFRDRFGVRPGVDVRQPMMRINVQLYDARETRNTGSHGREGRHQQIEPRCALSLDSSDPALHQRGYRQGGGDAPLKETLAAAIIALSGYPELGPGLDSAAARASHGEDAGSQGEGAASHAVDPTSHGADFVSRAADFASRAAAGELPPLVDLCCGSGTLLCEGGLRALGIAPGLSRQFGFMSWRDFDAGLWQRLKKEAQEQQRSATGPFLFGADLDGRALQTAQRGLEAAGLMKYARLACGDLRDAEPPPGPGGIVICNPPYGERLGHEAELVELYRGLGDTLKRRFVGYTAYVFTANLALGRQIGLRPSARHVLYNANLEGRLLQFKLY
jgi:23S rRNA G2445 N2-methylase RlmL